MFSCLCFLVCGTLAGLYLLVALRAMTPHPELESLEPEKMLAICGVSRELELVNSSANSKAIM